MKIVFFFKWLAAELQMNRVPRLEMAPGYLTPGCCCVPWKRVAVRGFASEFVYWWDRPLAPRCSFSAPVLRTKRLSKVTVGHFPHWAASSYWLTSPPALWLQSEIKPVKTVLHALSGLNKKACTVFFLNVAVSSFQSFSTLSGWARCFLSPPQLQPCFFGVWVHSTLLVI